MQGDKSSFVKEISPFIKQNTTYLQGIYIPVHTKQ